MSKRLVLRLIYALAGLSLAVVALACGFMLAIFALFACEGSDTSERPPPDSLAHDLCGWPGTVAFWTSVPLSVAAPAVGGLWSSVADRAQPLALGSVGAAAALTALCVFLAVLFRGAEILVPAIGALLVALGVERFVARRVR